MLQISQWTNPTELPLPKQNLQQTKLKQPRHHQNQTKQKNPESGQDTVTLDTLIPISDKFYLYFVSCQ